MTALFFLIGTIFLFHELTVFYNPRKFAALTKKMTDKEWIRSKETETKDKVNGCLYLLINISYVIWCVIGLAFSTQWLSFIVLFVVGIIYGLTNKAFRMKNMDQSVLAMGVKSLDALICAFVIFDIFMTHFQGNIWGTGFVRSIFGL